MTAYHYPGGLPAAAVLMSIRPGYVEREVNATCFTGRLRVITPDGEKKLDPDGWVLFFPDRVDCMDKKTFMNEYFDLFF